MSATGLRERKKQQTRTAIAQQAEALFTARGFDRVTITEVADAVGVSVKTVHNYFGSKEDLAFAHEDQVCAAWIHLVARRPADTSPFDALIDHVIDSFRDDEVVDRSRTFRAMVDDSPALQSRQRLVWDRLELAFAEILAAESGTIGAPDPTARFVGAQLASIVRLVLAPDVQQWLQQVPADHRAEAAATWLGRVRDLALHGAADRSPAST